MQIVVTRPRTAARAVRLGAFVLAVLWAAPAVAQAPAVELVMVEEEGCIWCARWNRDIAPAYPHTPEGRAARLRRIDLNDPVPEDLHLEGALIFTPTFILVLEGQEASRIEGYPGDEFFWGLLGMMLRDAGVVMDKDPPKPAGAAERR